MKKPSFFSVKIYIYLLMAWATGVFFTQSSIAQSWAGLVRPDPLVFEVGQGQVERLAIVLEDSLEVYGLDVRARFDPDYVEIVDMNADQEGVQMIPGEFPKPDFIVRNQADNIEGALIYVLTQVNPSPPANGNGVIMWVEVRGKKLGETPFVIDFVDAADREGKSLQIQKKDGVIRVVKPKPPTPTATTEIYPTQTDARFEAQPTKAKKTQKTLTVTPTIETGTEAEQKWISYNQVLLIITGGSLTGAIILFSYASYLSRKPKR